MEQLPRLARPCLLLKEHVLESVAFLIAKQMHRNNATAKRVVFSRRATSEDLQVDMGSHHGTTRAHGPMGAQISWLILSLGSSTWLKRLKIEWEVHIWKSHFPLAF